MRIGFHGIENIARESVQEGLGRGPEFLRMHQIQRFGWLQAFNRLEAGGKARQGVETGGWSVHGLPFGALRTAEQEKRGRGSGPFWRQFCEAYCAGGGAGGAPIGAMRPRPISGPRGPPIMPIIMRWPIMRCPIMPRAICRRPIPWLSSVRCCGLREL